MYDAPLASENDRKPAAKPAATPAAKRSMARGDEDIASKGAKTQNKKMAHKKTPRVA